MTDLVAQVRRHLADIPELTIEVSHYLTPGTAPLDPTNQAKGKGSIYKTPIVAEIYDLLDDSDKDLDDVTLNRTNGERRLGVLPTLGLWVSLVFAELDDLGRSPRECCPHRNHTITGEANWLHDYAEDILELHPDFPHDIKQLWTELRRACRIRAEYQPRCPQCNNHVQGVYGAETDVAPAWWQCTGCKRTWVHDAEVKRLALTQPSTRMPLAQIAKWLGLPLRTLRNWRREGRISPDSKGLYEVDHVKRAAEKLGRKLQDMVSA